ncbi:23S rRNA (adenine(2030)-N(6))-methyltransferase RlmJ [Nibricoccus aquaticus]|uniref:Ribosomal RNA large subunit methyltransferase J n=1 Tax=Nibricoccus aquaticus TaxID=2576891 RepID=A0A290Q6K0_9BACT|nr:23S rRNA (adenine(2030)-N(6))-methyltransferase RlmJ [Nibricoccus aquaticus]ATC62810.1 23S rRNA (adenine(2030)-N(6))-methyltransferase RlmJ [Nibricoccus aquaticus]
MNYRHQFHAGNFADVMKHVLLLQLARGMQRKEKGFFYLDTHAGRGRYDLAAAGLGDSLARKAEHPDGIGRLLGADGAELLAPIAEYVRVVRAFDGQPVAGGEAGEPALELRAYPGSPWIFEAAAREQDRLALCEKHPEEAAFLTEEFSHKRRVTVHAMDGYTAVRAMLPPLEKRALVLIDPPFEAQNEFGQVVEALGEGLRRMPAATFAVWYPLTERARVDEFLFKLEALRPPPCFAAELTIAGEDAPVKLKGCGLLVINPPWQIDREIAPVLEVLAKRLAVAPGGAGKLRWVVAE